MTICKSTNTDRTNCMITIRGAINEHKFCTDGRCVVPSSDVRAYLSQILGFARSQIQLLGVVTTDTGAETFDEIKHTDTIPSGSELSMVITRPIPILFETASPPHRGCINSTRVSGTKTDWDGMGWDENTDDYHPNYGHVLFSTNQVSHPHSGIHELTLRFEVGNQINVNRHLMGDDGACQMMWKVGVHKTDFEFKPGLYWENMPSDMDVRWEITRRGTVFRNEEFINNRNPALYNELKQAFPEETLACATLECSAGQTHPFELTMTLNTDIGKLHVHLTKAFDRECNIHIATSEGINEAVKFYACLELPGNRVTIVSSRSY